jgi:hypothetical protein
MFRCWRRLWIPTRMACFFPNLIPAWEFIVSRDEARHTGRDKESLSAVDSCNDMDEACAQYPHLRRC